MIITEAWKNQGFNGFQTRDLRDTSAEVPGSNPVEALIFSGLQRASKLSMRCVQL